MKGCRRSGVALVHEGHWEKGCVADRTDKTRDNGRTMEGDERGARRTTRLIEATYVAYGDAHKRVEHMKTQDLGGGGGIGSSVGMHKSCLLVDIKRGRSGDYTRVYTTFGLALSRQDRQRYEQNP